MWYLLGCKTKIFVSFVAETIDVGNTLISRSDFAACCLASLRRVNALALGMNTPGDGTAEYTCIQVKRDIVRIGVPVVSAFRIPGRLAKK
jgi:hypothetical protein